MTDLIGSVIRLGNKTSLDLPYIFYSIMIIIRMLDFIGALLKAI